MKLRRGILTLFLMFTVTFGALAVPQPAHAAPVVAVVAAVAATIGTVVVSVASFIASVVVQVGILVQNVALAAWHFVEAVGGAFSAAFQAADFVSGVGTFFTELGGAVLGFGAELATAMETFFAGVGEAWGELANSLGFGSGESAATVGKTAEGCTGTGVCASTATIETTAGGAAPSGFSGLDFVTAPAAAGGPDVIIVQGTREAFNLLTVEGITGLGTAGASALAIGDVFTYQPSPNVPGEEYRVVSNQTVPGSRYPTYEVEPVFSDRIVVTGTRLTGGFTAPDISSILAGANIATPGVAGNIAVILALFGNNSSNTPLCPNIGVKVFDGTNNDLKNKYVYIDTFKNHVSAMDVNRPSDIYHGTAGNPSAQGVRSCKLVDPSSFPTCWTTQGYNSPGDNIVMKWNGTQWFHTAANGNNNYYSHLTCTTMEPPEAHLVASKTTILPGEDVSLLWSSPYGDVRKASCVADGFSLTTLVPAHEECHDEWVSDDAQIEAAVYNMHWERVCEWFPDSYAPRPYVGTNVVNPTETTTYEYTCSNANGSTKASATVEVVAPSDLPDLSAEAISPTVFVKNMPSTLTAPVRNLHAVAASGFTSLLELDDDADHETVPFAGFVSLEGLAGNAVESVSASYTFPTAGTYYGRVCADTLVVPPGIGLITEADEDNNCGPWTELTVTDSVLPDLTVTSMVTPTETRTGAPTTFSATVINIGMGSTTNGFSNLFQIDDDGLAPILVERADVSPALLAPGNDVTQVAYTFSEPATYKVRACADAGSNLADSLVGTIFESTETNNCGPWTDVIVLPTSAQCTDGIDNDRDGTTDMLDPDCTVGGTDGEGFSCSVSTNSVRIGESVTYTAYNGAGPYHWTASDGASVPGTGASVTRTFSAAGSYGMSVTGAGSLRDECPLVTACDVCVPPVVAIRATPTLVDPRPSGGSTTLYWSANTGSCTITSSQGGAPIFSGTPTGTEQAQPVTGILRQTRYTLSCTNPGGTSQASVLVNVIANYDEF